MPQSGGSDSSKTQRELADVIVRGVSVKDIYSRPGQAGIKYDETHTLFEGMCREDGRCVLIREEPCEFWGHEEILTDVVGQASLAYRDGDRAWIPAAIDRGLLIVEDERPEVPEKEEKKEVVDEESEEVCSICLEEGNDPDNGVLRHYEHKNCGCKCYVHENCLEKWHARSDKCVICRGKCSAEDMKEITDVKVSVDEETKSASHVDEDDGLCTTCYVNDIDGCYLPCDCKLKMCETCLEEWIRARHKCSICKKSFAVSDIK